MFQMFVQDHETLNILDKIDGILISLRIHYFRCIGGQIAMATLVISK